MPPLNNPEILSDRQMEEFNKNGFLIMASMFNSEEVDAMKSEADRILAQVLNASLSQNTRDPRLDCTQYPDQSDYLDIRKIQPVNDMSTLLENVSKDPRLVTPLYQLMHRRNPIIMEEKLNYKQKVYCPEYIQRIGPPTGASNFFLHHDWGYYRSQGYPQDTLSSAVSIDETTSELGPIRVIPGSHKKEWPLKDPDITRGSGIVIDGLFSDEDKLEINAPPGSVMFFHSLLLHDSCPNTTGNPRRLMIYSHYPDNYIFEEDARNRHGRKAGQEFETKYMNMKMTGEYTDEFSW